MATIGFSSDRKSLLQHSSVKPVSVPHSLETPSGISGAKYIASSSPEDCHDQSASKKRKVKGIK